MRVDFDARAWLRVTYSRLRHGRTDGCASGGVWTNAIGGGGAETGEGVEEDGRTRRRSKRAVSGRAAHGNAERRLIR